MLDQLRALVAQAQKHLDELKALLAFMESQQPSVTPETQSGDPVGQGGGPGGEPPPPPDP